MFLNPNFDLPDVWNPVSPAGCRLWRVGVADSAQHQLVRSSIPTLILAGEYDASVTPLVRQIRRRCGDPSITSSPAGPHVQLANFNPVSAYARSITDQFLNAPTRRPDASCIRSLPPFDFTP